MFEKFSGAARETVIMAQAEARSLHHDHIGTEHLLLGLLHDSGVAGRVLAWHGLQLPQLRDALTRIVGTGEIDAQALASLGIDLDEVRRRVEANFGEGALDRPAGRGRRIGCNHIPFTAPAKKTLELTLREALVRKDGYIGTEHILLGLTRDVGCVSERLLRTCGVELSSLRTQVDQQLRDRA